MQEDTTSLGSRSWSGIQHSGPRSRQLRQRLVDILDLQADVVHPLATLFKEARDATRGIGRLQQLDLAATRTTQRQEGDLDTLAREVDDTRWRETQRIAVEAQRRVHLAHNNRHMINALDAASQAMNLHRMPPERLFLSQQRGSSGCAQSSSGSEA